MKVFSNRSREQGAVLVTSLLLLVVMILLGLTAMQMTRMEERMAGNTRDGNLAFQGAEAGLRNAEDWIRTLPERPEPCASAPCTLVWPRDSLPEDLRGQTLAWWQTNGREFGVPAVTEMAELAREPIYAINEMQFVPDDLDVDPTGRDFYRINASSSGATATAQSVLESTYARRF
jgi:type IV pilus assembly protein PilX